MQLKTPYIDPDKANRINIYGLNGMGVTKSDISTHDLRLHAMLSIRTDKNTWLLLLQHFVQIILLYLAS